MQDVRVGGRPTRTQYQYTLQDADLDELNLWAPRVLERLKALPQLRGQQGRARPERQMSLEAIASSFLLVAASEMGDKTQLLAFSLATRFRKPWAIMAGILVATVLNHALASSLGSWISASVSPRLMAAMLAASFIGFGLWTLKPDTLEESKGPARFGAFLTTAVLFFLAEMGDKTQLATVALAAQFRSVATVTVGTTLGMLAADGLAVFLGERLAARVQMRWIRWGAASLFFAFGGIALWSALAPAGPGLPALSSPEP